MGKYTSIGIVCEGGIGSSAMGAAMLKKVLNENGLNNISVKAYAMGLADLDAELFICQKDYYNHVKEQFKGKKVFLAENLLNKEEYQALARWLVET